METLYYNWDRREVRNQFYKNSYFYYDNILNLSAKLQKWVCFDEIHKMPEWKNILKDIYDSDHKKIKFIVTGSARLDMFRQSGDSLTGRYYLFHLLPFTLQEVNGISKDAFLKNNIQTPTAEEFIESKLSNLDFQQDIMKQLLQFSGFPEPFTESKNKLFLMWKNNYLDTVLREDIRELSNIKNLENVAQLTTILPSKIGNPLSVNSLTKGMAVSYPAIKNYLYALELCYFIFKISPYSKKINRAIKKEQKIYFFDWTRNISESARFENYLAFELYSLVTYWKDHGIGNFSLHYVRDRDGHESDFLITLDNTPWILIEAKLNETDINRHHINQSVALGNIPFVQLICKNNIVKKFSKNHFVISASRFFSS